MKNAISIAALLSTLDVWTAAEETAGKCAHPNLVASEVVTGWTALPTYREPSNTHDVPYEFPRAENNHERWWVLGSASTVGSTYMVWCIDHPTPLCPWATLGHCAITNRAGGGYTYTWSTCTDG